MAPRLKAVPLTPEDAAVWQGLRARWPRDHSAYSEFMFADRRDAASMLSREQFRQQCANIRAPDMRPALWWCLYIAGLM